MLSDQLEILTEQNIRGTPALVSEILSPGTSRRDRGIKRDLYSRGGVREYWIVDAVGNRIEVWGRAGDRGLQSVGAVSGTSGDTLITPLLPGFALPLEEFFRP